jgi:hypothetical protein
MKELGIEDVMIQTDLDGTGGLLVIRDGDDPGFIKRTRQNTARIAGAQARVLKIFRDEILALKGAPLAKSKGRG